EGLHRHRIGEDSRRLQLLSRARDPQFLSGLMHLHSTGAGEPYDPDEASAGGKKLLDFGLQIRFILARVGVLDRQGRYPGSTAGLVRNVADGETGRAEVFGGWRKTDIDADILDRGIARQDSISDARRLPASAPRGGTFNGVAIRQLIGSPGPELIGAEGS